LLNCPESVQYSSQPQNSQFDVEEGEGEGEEHSISDNNDDGNEDSISDARGLEVEKE
jgi:hypothetical protein